jgi:hypothetical protein
VSQIGAADTPGLPVSPATALCTQILHGVGEDGPLQGANTGALLGSDCTNMALLVAAADKESVLSQTGLAAALAEVGSIDLSYPAGPADFSNPKLPSGGQYWRPVNFHTSCNCWQVTSATWTRGA